MISKFAIANLLSRISLISYYKIAYFHNRKRFLSVSTPKDISQFVISKIIDGSIESKFYLADKFEVRKYVEAKGLSSILIPIYGVWSCLEDIDYNKLPDSYILKMNYGAGMNFICKNKSSLNTKLLNRIITSWFLNKKNYIEPHYNLIQRKVICEKLLVDKDGGSPVDYKFFCFNGKVACILACSGRHSGHETYQTYSLEWEYMPEFSRRITIYKEIEKPLNLTEMITVAEKLSVDLEFVRVDLYSVNNKVYFGELTLTPAGGIFHGWSQEGINFLGSKINNIKHK